MPDPVAEHLRQELGKHKLMLIKEFVDIFLIPHPFHPDYRYFKIKTLDGYSYTVWGKSPAEVLEQFQRFLNLRLFL